MPQPAADQLLENQHQLLDVVLVSAGRAAAVGHLLAQLHPQSGDVGQDERLASPMPWLAHHELRWRLQRPEVLAQRQPPRS
jgi:hypothetical protein